MATTSPIRIVTLDLVRGIAVMGIFSVNIVGMGLYGPAYSHPPAFGFEGLGDKLMWLANFILVDGKMRTLFTLLFGASSLLVIERSIEAGRKAGRAHYARMITLLLFGLAHFYLVWQGDILTEYALGGLLIFLWRNRKTKTILIWAVVLLVINAGLVNSFPVPDQFRAAEELRSGTLEGDRREQVESMLESLDPSPEHIAEEAEKEENPAAYLRDGIGQGWQPHLSILFWVGELLGTMLVGMALYRMGFLSGAMRDSVYRRWAIWAAGGGIVLSAALGLLVWQKDFGFEWTFAARNAWQTLFRVPMAIGYAALIILLFRRVGALGERIAAVGRTAFSNYLGASLLMVPVFQGWGLGLYDELSRGQLWLFFVPAVWALMLLWSPWWLQHYRYGPLEWLWRSIARGQVQPLRRAQPAA
ncbi:DUF418 domain-containing protein [Sphingomicrobium nitratireducens]|uniref:DUF418 domain-containing protein n=1 Tax=Sphingomicrobium nitratireducens TaxID=2964666 RepID=UPI00223EC46D|nr:DUF418 domain-containing protein [Sphingomicrobium nitratireducens]